MMFRTFLFAVALAVGVVSCGTKSTSNQQGNTVLPPSLPSPSPSTSTPVSSCTLPLQAALSVVTPASDIKVGTPTAFRVNAVRCSGDRFHVKGREASEFFDSTLNFTKTYSAAGVVAESIVLEVWDVANLSSPVQTQALSVVLTVLPVSPPPPSQISCRVDRVPGQVITRVDDPIAATISVTGNPTQILVNGLAVVAGQTFYLTAQSPSSGTYIANGQVSNGVQTVNCQQTFLTPICQHRVTSATAKGVIPKITLNTSTTLGGPVMQVDVNEDIVTTLPVLPNNVLDHTNTEIPYQAGALTSTAKVYAPFGDTVVCSDTYTATLPLDPVFSSVVPYIALTGFALGADRAMSGFGAAPQGTKMWTFRQMDYPIMVTVPFAVSSRVGVCGRNEIAVGKPPWPDYPTSLSLILCAPLRPELRLKNHSVVSFAWGYNVFGACPGNKVITGMAYNGSTQTLACAEIYQP